MASEKELMGASTALLVLSCLASGPSYGYELLKRINHEAGGIFTWQEGTLYPVLHRLEQDGRVRAQWEKLETGTARRRKYYYITALGRRSLTESTKQWHAFYALINRMTQRGRGAGLPQPN